MKKIALVLVSIFVMSSIAAHAADWGSNDKRTVAIPTNTLTGYDENAKPLYEIKKVNYVIDIQNKDKLNDKSIEWMRSHSDFAFDCFMNALGNFSGDQRTRIFSQVDEIQISDACNHMIFKTPEASHNSVAYFTTEDGKQVTKHKNVLKFEFNSKFMQLASEQIYKGSPTASCRSSKVKVDGKDKLAFAYDELVGTLKELAKPDKGPQPPKVEKKPELPVSGVVNVPAAPKPAPKVDQEAIDRQMVEKMEKAFQDLQNKKPPSNCPTCPTAGSK